MEFRYFDATDEVAGRLFGLALTYSYIEHTLLRRTVLQDGRIQQLMIAGKLTVISWSTILSQR